MISMFWAGTACTPPYEPISGLICSPTIGASALLSGIVTVTIRSSGTLSSTRPFRIGVGFWNEPSSVAR